MSCLSKTWKFRINFELSKSGNNSTEFFLGFIPVSLVYVSLEVSLLLVLLREAGAA